MANRKHYWRKLAEALGVEYNTPFYTDGWGAYKITAKGLYSYEDKGYTDEWGNLYPNLIEILDGNAVIIRDISKWEQENNCKLTTEEV